MKITCLIIASFSLSATVSENANTPTMTAQNVPNGFGGSSDATNGAQNTPSAFRQIEGQAIGVNSGLTPFNPSSVPDNKQPPILRDGSSQPLNADYSSLVESPTAPVTQPPPATPPSPSTLPTDQLTAVTISSNPSYQATNLNLQSTPAPANSTTIVSPSGSSDAVPLENTEKDTCIDHGWIACQFTPGCHWVKLCQSKSSKVSQ